MISVTKALRIFGLALALVLAIPALPFMAETAEKIAACRTELRGEGCATLLSRLYVCRQAQALPGCAALITAAEAAEALRQTLSTSDAMHAQKPQAPEDPSTTDCPVLVNKGWSLSPSATGALLVRGEITLPTPGYQLTLTVPEVFEPPITTLLLRVVRPVGIVPQVLADYAVEATLPAPPEAVRALVIRCGAVTLAELDLGPAR